MDLEWLPYSRSPETVAVNSSTWPFTNNSGMCEGCGLPTNGAAIPENEARLRHLWWVAYGLVAPVILAVGVAGNTANLLVLSQPNLRGANGVTYVYLTWLATVDLLCQVIAFPTLMTLLAHGEDAPLGYAAATYRAHVELALVNGLMAASAFIVVTLTVDRYASVSRPIARFGRMKAPRAVAFRGARARAGLACGLAFALNAPMVLYKKVHEVGPDYYEARVDPHVVDTLPWKAYHWTKEIVTRIGPALVLAALNLLIIRRFHGLVERRRRRRKRLQCKKATSSVPSSQPVVSVNPTLSLATVLVTSLSEVAPSAATSVSSSSSFGEERRLVALLGGISLMFLVTATPAAFLSLFNSDEAESDFRFQVFRACANDAELLNYALNFYVYCLCSSEIRRTFLAMLGSCAARVLPWRQHPTTWERGPGRTRTAVAKASTNGSGRKETSLVESSNEV